MSMGNLPPIDPYAGTPPTQPRYAAPMIPRVPSWPKVIGIISIVLACKDLFDGVMGVVVPYVLDLFASVFKGPGPRFSAQVTQFEAIKAHAVESQVNGMIELIVGSLLLAVGIGLVRRRAWSARLSYVYIIANLLQLPVAAYLAARMQAAQFDAMAANAQAGPFSGLSQVIVPLTVAAVIVFGGAYPVFLLIWIARRSAREEMARWS